MKQAYPIIMSKGSERIVVYIPDFDINTQGDDYPNAMEMARDAIGLIGIDLEDDMENIPLPSDISAVICESSDDIVTLVDVDFDEYRKKHDNRVVRRNITLPAWLDAAASSEKINVSRVTQEALKEILQSSN
ncbi:MAG: type II toxin-antitoxin system HicB family antitoxin [Oscillospiraceae bacterium]|nr:type II toxin-antitoxin system HicB family antitoxin [Oscillospiraceae bacterium]